MKRKRKLVLVFLVILFGLLSSFLDDGDIILISSSACIEENAGSPSELLLLSESNNQRCITKLENCIEKKGHDQLIFFWRSNNKFYFTDPAGNNKTYSNWFSKDHFLLYNDLIRHFAIAAHVKNITIDPIIVDVEQGIFVFRREFGGKDQIWAWHLEKGTKNELKKCLIKETLLVELIAGEKATKEFAEYLKRSDNFKRSLLSRIIKDENAGKVVAILPINCVKNGCDNLDSFSSWRTATKDQPSCLPIGLNNNSPLDFLVETHENGYKVWSHTNTSPQDAPFFEKNEKEIRESSPEQVKWLAWYQIAKLACCKLLFTDNALDIYVLACEEINEIEVIILKWNPVKKKIDFDIYRPLDFIDPKEKKRIFQDLQGGTGFGSLALKKLVSEWARDPSKANFILAYGDRRKLPPQVNSFSEIIENARKNRDWKSSSLLVEERHKNSGQYIKSTSNKFRIFEPNGKIIESTWYSDFSSKESSSLALLAILFPDATVIDNGLGSDEIILVAGDNNYAAGLELSSFKEYPFLNQMFEVDVIGRPLAEALGKAIRSDQSPFLLNHVKQHFAGNRDIIRLVFPTGFSGLSGTSPMAMLGNPSSGAKIAPVVEAALSSRKPLSFLLESSSGTFSMVNSSGSSITPSSFNNTEVRALLATENPWFAWLFMADNGLQVVASQTSPDLRLVMTSESKPDVAWSWVASNKLAFPREEKILDGDNNIFLLTGESQSDYVKNLPDLAGEKERAFFLERADLPRSFVLLDMSQDPQRVILYRENSSDQRQILRLSDFNSDAPINLHLVGATLDPNWENLKELYNKDWVRSYFIEEVAISDADPLVTWFSSERLGINRGGSIGIFLEPPVSRNRFNFTSFGRIRALIDQIVYVPGNKPSIGQFINDCMVPYDFENSERWRANPLGYFDRAN